MDTIEVALSVYDDEGIVVDTTTATLTSEQLNDLINTAVQVIYGARAVDSNPTSVPAQDELAVALSELEEVLEVYDLIEEEKYVPGQG